MLFNTRLHDLLQRHFQDVFARRIQDVSKTNLQDVFFKTSRKIKNCYAEDVFKTSSRRLQYVFSKTNLCWVENKKFFKIVMRCDLSISGILFDRELRSCNRAHKQNTKAESKVHEVIRTVECYKIFHLYDKSLLSSAYSRVQTKRKEEISQTK